MNSNDSATLLDAQWTAYRHWTKCAVVGDRSSAKQGLAELLAEVTDLTLQSRIHNDLGVLATARGDKSTAHQAFIRAQDLAPEWSVPLTNLERLEAMSRGHASGTHRSPSPSRPTRIGIVSLLFNWPSTGGGTVHTAELARFLTRAGYDVRHFVICQAKWGIGNVTNAVDWPLTRLEFADADWHQREIQRRVRQAVDEFSPDSVIITDSWSFKPRLAEALQGVRYFLRLAAQECLCPLNNVRLLWDSSGPPRACPKHQLATPTLCGECVRVNGQWSGSLHQAERHLAGFDQPDYDMCLRQAFANAEGILVVNPLVAELVKPHVAAVHVVPSGFDAARFPDSLARSHAAGDPVRLLFAGLVEEPMKGFSVLHAACKRIWARRQDFRLLVTTDPQGSFDEFTEFIGWQSQACLPAAMWSADIVVCPTIAEEALGRTAVEGMGASRPVVASRIGGLQFAVLDEATGLLCEPGDPKDLARQLTRLLDSTELRDRLGRSGRERFVNHFTWDVILDRHYRKLLGASTRPQ